jgi:hypothetical protein
MERPRCFDAPFFWKDAYVLVGPWARRYWTVVYLLLAGIVFFAGLRLWGSEAPVTMGIIAECIGPILFAIRFDSLISAEFRLNTWNDLMLLPIDRRVLLWAKLKAVCWEQRMAGLPMGIAIAFGMFQAPTSIFMVGVVALLVGILLCQLTAINTLTHKSWENGVCTLFASLALITLCALLWIYFSPWPAFLMTATILAVVAIPMQSAMETTLIEWTESPNNAS